MVDILGLATALRAATTIIKIVFVFVFVVAAAAAAAAIAAAAIAAAAAAVSREAACRSAGKRRRSIRSNIMKERSACSCASDRGGSCLLLLAILN